MGTKIKLILFDLDGTLVDSAPDITHAVNFATAPFGVAPAGIDEIIGMIGDGTKKLVEKVLGEKRAMLLDEVYENFLAYYTSHISDFTKPYATVMDTLRNLEEYTLAVVSNKFEHLSIKLLKELEMDSCFLHIIGGDTTGQRKPSPGPILEVLNRSGVKPSDAVMVGDSSTDIEAGKNANVFTVGAGYGYKPIETLNDADFIIHEEMWELLKILEKFR